MRDRSISDKWAKFHAGRSRKITKQKEGLDAWGRLDRYRTRHSQEWAKELKRPQIKSPYDEEVHVSPRDAEQRMRERRLGQ